MQPAKTADFAPRATGADSGVIRYPVHAINKNVPDTSTNKPKYFRPLPRIFFTDPAFANIKVQNLIIDTVCIFAFCSCPKLVTLQSAAR
jgi:hypothetical protein